MVTDEIWRNNARLLMIVPTRGRPDNAEELCDAWSALGRGRADLLFAVDDDDPALPDYQSVSNRWNVTGVTNVTVYVGPRLRLGGTLNAASRRYIDAYDAIGFMGDDHLMRTGSYDLALLAELERLGTGIVYGNDLIHGPALPTAVAMTSDIIRTLGYMVPAGLVHMFADNAWKAWGEGIGRLSYLPDVVIEHVHPLVGKAPMDDLYRETEQLMEPDSRRWNDYRLMGGLDADIERLRHMIQATEAARSDTGCVKGHADDEYNYSRKLDGTRACGECSRERESARYELWFGEANRGVAAV